MSSRVSLNSLWTMHTCNLTLPACMHCSVPNCRLGKWEAKRFSRKCCSRSVKWSLKKTPSQKVQETIAGIQDEEEREYQAALIKKNYLGAHAVYW